MSGTRKIRRVRVLQSARDLAVALRPHSTTPTPTSSRTRRRGSSRGCRCRGMRPLDSQLSLTDTLPPFVRAGFYQLPAQMIRPVAIRSLTSAAATTIIQAFIVCRLDWCNSLLCGVPLREPAQQDACSLCRTLPLVYSPAHGSVITSLL